MPTTNSNPKAQHTLSTHTKEIWQCPMHKHVSAKANPKLTQMKQSHQTWSLNIPLQEPIVVTLWMWNPYQVLHQKILNGHLKQLTCTRLCGQSNAAWNFPMPPKAISSHALCYNVSIVMLITYHSFAQKSRPRKARCSTQRPESCSILWSKHCIMSSISSLLQAQTCQKHTSIKSNPSGAHQQVLANWMYIPILNKQDRWSRLPIWL